MTAINHALEHEFGEPEAKRHPPVPPPRNAGESSTGEQHGGEQHGSEQPPEPRGLSRCLDAFLQPGNIKWLLIAGVLILLASSLMLVIAHWNDYTPAWKYLILVGYTAGTWLAGRWSYHRLALRRTGTVIMALTVLLLPVSFLALNLVTTGPPWVVMLALNFALAGAAARDVFRHFLRGDQPTFLACYLLLCAAGAFVWSATGPFAAALVALGLWAAFAVGAIKVNRHVFWLVEENRWPRVFGFFPILLLGSQFLVLYALGPAGHLPEQWMGLGCGLVAAVVLATSDSVARVFQQRTGDLVRPLPLAIIAPLVLGLALCAAGLCLSAAGLVPPARPYAVVPTAVVVAALLALVARRTGRPGFVWAALVVATVAYNFSPVFFTTLARAAISHGAAAVRESRLPYPFYGLTYLPLLVALLGFGAIARRRGWSLPLGPVRDFCLGLSCVLLAVSLGHPKAVFPVAAAMTAVLAAQAFVFRDRRPVLPAIAAFLMAALGLCPFLHDVVAVALPSPAAELIAVTAAAVLLLAPGFLIDARIARLPLAASPVAGPHALWANESCQLISLALSAVLPIAWIMLLTGGTATTAVWLAAAGLSGLLLVHSLIRVDKSISVFTLCIVQFFALRWAAGLTFGPGTLLSIATLALLTQWVISRVLLRRRPAWRVTRALAEPANLVSGIALAGLLVGVYLPAMSARGLGAEQLMPALLQPWTWVAAILVGWGGDGARRWSSPALATAACLTALATVAAGLVDVTHDTTWVAAALSAMAIAGLGAGVWLARRGPGDEWGVLSDAATRVSLGVLTATAAASLVWYTAPIQTAGVIAAGGLLVASRLRSFPSTLRSLALALISWQAAAMFLAFLTPSGVGSAEDLRLADLIPASLPLACLVAAALLVWQRFGDRLDLEVARHQRVLLRAGVAACLLISTARPTHTSVDFSLAGAAFLLLIGSELWSACRRQHAARAWSAQIFMLAAVAYFAHAGLIRFGSGVALYVPLAAAAAFRCAAGLARRRTTTAILAGPFSRTALALPMATVFLAIWRELHTPVAGWLGANSLALFLAAGFYFWRGLERRQPAWHIAAAAIANVALALLWHELRLADPQFYLVPLGASVLLLAQVLKRELPADLHDPLRYAGALLVLVSPTFHIVGGSWGHLLSLMVLSVAVMLVGMGLRVRALLYAGSAFLTADLVAMVVRGSIDQPSLLWVAGLAIGAIVLALGAAAERNREHLLQRVRTVSVALAEWD